MPSDGSKKCSVIIVDPDDSFAGALAAGLRANGVVVEKTDFGRAIGSLEKFEPDLLIWDIEAPSARDLLQQIVDRKPDMTVIAMAKRSDRRNLSSGRPPAPFIDKRQGVEVALRAIADFLAQREGNASSSASGAAHAKSAEIEFLAKISHELRTPLNAIIGFSELIIQDSRLSLDQAQQRSYVEDIYASGRHLLDVINDILDFARAESGKLLLQESETDIEEALASVNRLLGPRIRDGGLQLGLTLPRHIRYLWCDERKLKRMLLNLMTNAIKATPSGGRIDIEVADTVEGIVFIVSDNGVGIPKEGQDRVFEPFVQVENSLNRSHEGTGLGLPLVKAMIEIHGGHIELESEHHKGTTVRLVFPRSRLGTFEVEDDNGKVLDADRWRESVA